MKTKFTSCLIVGILFLSSLSYAQDTRSIELTISDTITLKATKYIYQIIIGNKVEVMGISINELNQDTPVSISDITKLLDKGKFQYSFSETKDYEISKSNSSQNFEVVLPNETELKRLFTVLKAQKGITCKIKNTIFEPLSNYQEDIYSQLYAKALKQANMMAKISGNTIGKVISISDVENDILIGMNINTLMMKNMPFNILGDESVSEKKEVVHMVFKFELK